MKEEIGLEEIESLRNAIIGLQQEHPQARVIYDIRRECLSVKYPLPRDYQALDTLLGGKRNGNR